MFLFVLEMDTNEREPLLSQPLNTPDPRKDNIHNSISGREDNKSSFSKIPNQKKSLLVSMTMVNFFMVTCYSLIAPFFPAEVYFFTIFVFYFLFCFVITFLRVVLTHIKTSSVVCKIVITSYLCTPLKAVQ